MAAAGCCTACGSRSLIRHEESGCLVCSSCGTLQAFDDFQIGGVCGGSGTYVQTGTSGTGSSLNYRDKKIYEAHNTIDDIVFRLGFSASISDDVRDMVDKITDGEFGLGAWFPVLVAACAYVVARKAGKNQIPIADVAASVGCEVYELGRMVARTVTYLGLQLPQFDIVASFQRAIRSIPSFARVPTDEVEAMLKQGVFLVQCAVKWFLTTGRRPLPVVAAVLVLVAELHGVVDVRIEDVAGQLRVSVKTAKLRYKELLQALVKVAKALPWGQDITVKNIVKNAPFVLQYMEVKSRTSKLGENKAGLEEIGFRLEDVVTEFLSKDDDTDGGYGGFLNDAEREEGRIWGVVGRNDTLSSAGESGRSGSLNLRLGFDSFEQFKAFHDEWLKNYTKFLNDVAQHVSNSNGNDESGHASYAGEERQNERMLDAPLSLCDLWSGQSHMCKKLFLQQILETDVGLDALPPSFVSGRLADQRRREKINAAKLRIEKVMHPQKGSGIAEDPCRNSEGKKRKERGDVFDWEDFIIETLLLHRVREEEIEKGHYNALLGLHV